MAKQKPTKMLAILGRSQRTGRWRLASRSSVVAFLGSCRLDMRASFVEDDKLKMKVTVLLGSATFILPDGAEVRPSGMSVLAGSVVDVMEHDQDAELPMLEIEWTAILGRIRIVTHRDGDGIPDLETTAMASSVDSAAESSDVAETPSDEEPAVVPATERAGVISIAALAESPPAGIGFEDLDPPASTPDETAQEDTAEQEDTAAQPDPEQRDTAEPVGIGFEDL